LSARSSLNEFGPEAATPQVGLFFFLAG